MNKARFKYIPSEGFYYEYGGWVVSKYKTIEIWCGPFLSIDEAQLSRSTMYARSR